MLERAGFCVGDLPKAPRTRVMGAAEITRLKFNKDKGIIR